MMNVAEPFAAPRPTRAWEPDSYYQAYWEGAKDSLFVVRVLSRDRFVYGGINPAHEQATGLSAEAMCGLTPWECLDPAVAEEVTAHYRACVDAGEPIHYVEALDLPAGRRKIGRASCRERV